MQNIAHMNLGGIGHQATAPSEAHSGLLEQAREIGEKMKARTGYRTAFAGRQDTDLQKALKEACLMAARLKAGLPPHWLTLSGRNGTGKTMLANWLARRFEAAMLSGLLPRVWTYGQLRRGYLGGGYGLLDGLASEPWLVIDELGAAREQDSFRGEFVDCMMRRMGRWTVFTTNLSEPELEAVFTARLTSRMIRVEGVATNVHVRLECQDYARRAGI